MSPSSTIRSRHGCVRRSITPPDLLDGEPADCYDGTRVFAKTCHASADFATRLSPTYTYSPKT